MSDLSQSTLVELSELINEACERGETVRAIANRAGVSEVTVSLLKNQTYRKSPTLGMLAKIAMSLGRKISLTRLAKK